MKAFLIALAFVLIPPAGASAAEGQMADIEAVYDQLQREMMCLCGCNSTLKSCPHVNCDFAIPRREEMRKMLVEGKTREQITAAMVERFGEKILSAPKKQGFNILGYVMPFVAILAVGSVVAMTVRKWAGRGTAKREAGQAPPPAREIGEEGGLVSLMKKELDDFDK